MPVDIVTRGIRKPASSIYYQEGPPDESDLLDYRLVVKGAWGSRDFSLDELRAFPRVDFDRRSVCVCNWTIRHEYSGVLLEVVLKEAGMPRGDGEYLKQTSIGTKEKGTYESTVPLGDALRRRALLCYEIDREPLTMMRGFPLRFIDFGLYNYKCVKGLASLEITGDYVLGEWEARAGYPIDGTVRPKKYWVCDLQKSVYVPNEGEVTEF
jgi:DMSO/TMAO reductase YedYZ molybdopterin-dependent catalytic subunit